MASAPRKVNIPVLGCYRKGVLHHIEEGRAMVGGGGLKPITPLQRCYSR